jgi:transcriptional regulator with XRE-family HTH domain
MELHIPNLLAALEVKRWNQKDLADACGWSEAKASRLINGKTGEITLAILKDLEKALGVSAAHLVNLEDVAQTPAEKALLAAYRAASSRERHIAEAVLNPPKDD